MLFVEVIESREVVWPVPTVVQILFLDGSCQVLVPQAAVKWLDSGRSNSTTRRL
jgi:hypothetical protein